MLWLALFLALFAGAALALSGNVLAAVILATAALMFLLLGLQARAVYWRAFHKAEPKPTDGQIDDTFREDLERAANRAMEVFGLHDWDLVLHSADVRPPGGPRPFADQGAGPIVVFGPAKGAKAREGLDRVWRFSHYDVLVICPTERHLGVVVSRLDLASGRRKDENTDEFHYGHIVAVTTRTKPIADLVTSVITFWGYADTYSMTLARELQVIVASGDRTGIVVGVDERPGQPAVLQSSGIDYALVQLRNLLAHKRWEQRNGVWTIR